MKLVQFYNGTYGVRRYWLFGWHFGDLQNHSLSWTRYSQFFHDCQGTRKQAEDYLKKFSQPLYKVVKN